MSVDHPMLLTLLAILCLPVLDLWAWVLFGSSTGAVRAMRWLGIRDWRSLLRNEYVEDKFSEVRLGVLLGLYALTVAAAYRGTIAIYRLILEALFP